MAAGMNMVAANETPAEAGSLRALLAMLDQIERAGAVRRCALLHGDRLPRTRGRVPSLRLARATLAPLMRASRAQSFTLGDGRHAVIWRPAAGLAAVEELAPIRAALCHLLGDDLAGLGDPAMALLSVHDLPREIAALRATLQQPRPPPPALAPIPDEHLPALIAALPRADLAPHLRCHAIWQQAPDGRLHHAWDSYAISLPSLCQSLCPGHAPPAAREAIACLDAALAPRLLALLSRGILPGCRRALGIALPHDAVLGPAFLAFESSLPPAMRGRVHITLSARAMLDDPAAFRFALNFCRAAGHSTGIGGLPPSAAGLLDLGAAGAGFAVFSARALPACGRAQSLAALRERAAPAHVVLEDVDDAQLLAQARQAGITHLGGAALPG